MLFFQFLMTHCSSKSIHVLNKSTIITNINIKGVLSLVKVIQNCNHYLYELFLIVNDTLLY